MSEPAFRSDVAARPIVGVAVIAGAAAWFVGHAPISASVVFALSFVLLGILPASTGPRLHRRRLTELGIGLGDSRIGALLLLVGMPLGVLAGFVGAASPQLAAEYPLNPHVSPELRPFGTHALLYLSYYVGFEFLFRGYLLFGLERRLGSVKANLLQAALATIFHVGKPVAEFAAAFPASLLFGWAAYRTRSIWYGVLIHWAVGASLDWFLLAAP